MYINAVGIYISISIYIYLYLHIHIYRPRLNKRLWQLHHHFRDEIRRRAVGGGGVFAQED